MQEYRLINLIFIFLLILLFTYCFFLNSIPTNVAVKSNCKGSVYCKSEGLTRAFNSAVHGNFTDAKKYNPEYKSILLFFVTQLLLRILFFSLPYNRIKESTIIKLDILICIILFLSTFYVFLF